MRTAILLLVVHASVPASAATLFARTGVGLGFGLYTYPTQVQAGRSASGVLANYGLDAAAQFSNGLLVGGTASFDPILGINGISPSGTRRTALLTPGGGFGPLIGVHLDRFVVYLALMFGGGGAASIAGGFGPYLAPFVGYTFLKNERLHVMGHVRPLFGYLIDVQAGGPVLFLGGTGGISIALM